MAISILGIVTDEAQKANVSAVTQVRLCVGDLAGVEATTLSACFEMLAEGTIADRAKLVIKRIPATGSFLLYVTKTIGPAYGMLAAWAMLLAYLGTVIALTVACSMFFKGMITSLGLSLSVPNDVLYIIITAV